VNPKVMSLGVNGVCRQVRLKHLVSYLPYIIIALFLIICPPFMPPYIEDVITQILIFSIFALSLNLLFGYTGLFSVGHAAFFGVAAYAAGILMLHYGIESFWLVAPLGILMATIVAAVFGIIALRVSGIYFLFVTLALGELLSSIAWTWRSMTGGSSGLSGIPYPNLGLPFAMNATSFYYLVFIVLIICTFLLFRITKSPFGQALQGIREDELRMRFFGYNTWLHKYIAFIIAGLFAGVAGVLFASLSMTVSPEHLGTVTSVTVMLMVLIGSPSLFFGPLIGVAVVILLQYVVSLYAPDRWPLILGAVFVTSVMLLRGGIGVHLLRFRIK
jgi:branched-chain amino acid transport system permease protein